MTNPTSQQVFLRESMVVMGLNRRQFADRFHVSKRRLDNWLLPFGSDGAREIDTSVQQFIREVVRLHKLKTYIINSLAKKTMSPKSKAAIIGVVDVIFTATKP